VGLLLCISGESDCEGQARRCPSPKSCPVSLPLLFLLSPSFCCPSPGCISTTTPNHPTVSLFVWLVADGWCWFVLREKYCWLVAGGWFIVREKYCWMVADKPSEQAPSQLIPAVHSVPAGCHSSLPNLPLYVQ
jgi:hypothetical protein